MTLDEIRERWEANNFPFMQGWGFYECLEAVAVIKGLLDICDNLESLLETPTNTGVHAPFVHCSELRKVLHG